MDAVFRALGDPIRRQLLDSLQPLGETQQFDILFFNHRVAMFEGASGAKRATFATDTNKKLAGEFVQRIVADGGTDRALALKRALALQPSPRAPPAPRQC